MAEPVSLAQAKLHLRLNANATSEDALLIDIIAAARDVVEAHTGLILSPRTVVEHFPRFAEHMRLSAWPVAPDAAGELSYIDTSAQSQTLTDFRLSVARRPARLYPAIGSRWPQAYRAPDAVSLSIPAGYATPDDVPPRAIQAMKLLIGHFYANREAAIAGDHAVSAEVSLGVTSLLDKLRLRVL